LVVVVETVCTSSRNDQKVLVNHLVHEDVVLEREIQLEMQLAKEYWGL
jgi:hypothetical protein